MAHRLAKNSDARRRAVGNEPERSCALTREKGGPGDLLRFVCGPDGTIVPDIARKLPGRGVWLKADRETVERATRQNVFARSFKRPVVVPDDLSAQVERLLSRRAIQSLSLANKAGAVVAGFTKVEVAIARGEVAVLLHAHDASDDGARKLDGKLRAMSALLAENVVTSDPQILTVLNSAELSLALGRQNVVHAALRSGGAAKNFMTEAGRLKRYRASSHGEAVRPPQWTSNTEQV